jgi:hypothetical protein
MEADNGDEGFVLGRDDWKIAEANMREGCGILLWDETPCLNPFEYYMNQPDHDASENVLEYNPDRYTRPAPSRTNTLYEALAVEVRKDLHNDLPTSQYG